MLYAAWFKRSGLSFLVLALFVAVLDIPNSFAALVPADPARYGQEPAAAQDHHRDAAIEPSPIEDLRAQDLVKVQKVLETKVVKQRLEDLGLSAEEAQNRLNRLSDAQLHLLASQIDQLFPGGIDHVLGTILTVLLIILVAVIIVILV
jgi:hypothetical protein